MFNTVGVTDYAALAGTTAATHALHQSLLATNQSIASVTGSVLPPGSESASFLATGQHKTSVTDFATKIIDASDQLLRRNNIMTTYSASVAALDAEDAANIAALDAESFLSNIGGTH